VSTASARTLPAMAEQPRNKPRISLTLSPEARALGEELAAARGLSLSSLLEVLIREEAKRERRRKT
jgi:hypothetical protein